MYLPQIQLLIIAHLLPCTVIHSSSVTALSWSRSGAYPRNIGFKLGEFTLNGKPVHHRAPCTHSFTLTSEFSIASPPTGISLWGGRMPEETLDTRNTRKENLHTDSTLSLGSMTWQLDSTTASLCHPCFTRCAPSISVKGPSQDHCWWDFIRLVDLS